MAISTTSNRYRIPLQPGVNPFNNPGRFWKLLDCPVPIRVKIGDMPEMELVAGQGFDFPAGEYFERFEITNPLETTLTVTFWNGFVGFRDDRSNQFEAPTSFVPVAASGNYVPGSLGALGAVDLIESIAAGRLRRKAVQICNLDPATNLLICDTSDVVGAIVRPGETIAQPVSGPIRIKNTTGAAVACWLSEIYWTR